MMGFRRLYQIVILYFNQLLLCAYLDMVLTNQTKKGSLWSRPFASLDYNSDYFISMDHDIVN